MKLSKSIILCGVIVACLRRSADAELLLVTKTADGGLSSVTNKDPNCKILYETILKYQWPTCLATLHQLSDEEKQALFTPTPHAEENFIRQQVKKINQSYDVIFIPTILYELFCLSREMLGDAYFEQTKASSWESTESVKPVLERDGSRKQDVLNLYDVQNHASGLQNTFFAINEKLMNYLLRNGLFTDNKLFDVTTFEDVQQRVQKNLIAKMIKALITQLLIVDETNYFVFRDNASIRAILQQELNESSTENMFFYNVAKLEYEAREGNKALLYRGVSPFDAFLGYGEKDVEYKGKVLDLAVPASDKGEFEKLKELHRKKTLIPRSISYGNSLFAGIINDSGSRGASALLYFCEMNNAGYGLFIDKMRYADGDLAQLFFVAPLSPISALFARGEFFHSRTRVCSYIPSETAKPITGLYSELGELGVIDHPEIVYFEGDPLRHIERVATYLSGNNIRVLSPVGAKLGLFDQDRVPKFYKMLYAFDVMRRMVQPTLSELEKRLFNTYKEYVGGVMHEQQQNFSDVPVVSVREFVKAVQSFWRVNESLRKDRTLWLNNEPPSDAKPNIIQKIVVKPGAKILILGDLHGSVHSLLRNLRRLCILGFMNEQFKLKKDTYLVALGDYSNLGRYGAEVLYLLVRLFVKNPDHVVLLHGNHDDGEINKIWGLKTELVTKYGDDSDVLLKLMDKRIYPYLPVALFLGCHNTFGQFCHGGIEPAYNPQKFLSAHEKMYQAVERFTFPEEKSWSDGFIQSYFAIDNPQQRGEIVHRPNQPDGYLADMAAVAKFLLQSAYSNVKAFFRAHQHSYAGLKMLPGLGQKIDMASARIQPEQMPAGDKAYLPWWKDVVHAQKGKIDSTSDGILLKKYGPVFTFSSAPEGASYPPAATLDFDCIGILTVTESYDTWRLIPYEVPLDTTRNGKYVHIEKVVDWQGQLIDDEARIYDCLNVKFLEEPWDKTAHVTAHGGGLLADINNWTTMASSDGIATESEFKQALKAAVAGAQDFKQNTLMLLQELIKLPTLARKFEQEKELFTQALSFALAFSSSEDDDLKENLFLFIEDVVRNSIVLDEATRKNLLESAYKAALQGKQEFPEGAQHLFKEIIEASQGISDRGFVLGMAKQALGEIEIGPLSKALWALKELVKNQNIHGVDAKLMIFKTARKIVGKGQLSDLSYIKYSASELAKALSGDSSLLQALQKKVACEVWHDVQTRGVQRVDVRSCVIKYLGD
ncbi:MAG: metallophosphoesterase [Candidatus Babeliales bacterium]|jgi:hypothetical protein